MVHRHDLVEIRSPKIDQNGYLVADAFPTKVGVFKYVKPNGTITRELRHPVDVSSPASLESLKNRPIVDEHPDGGPMDANNTKRLSVGHVGEQVGMKGDHVQANLVVTDASMIAKMQGGKGGVKKNQLSCGYTADVIEETGTFKGHDYDHRQTNIVYNHLASVWKGRAGPTAAIHLDAEDAAAEDITIEIEDGGPGSGPQPGGGANRRKAGTGTARRKPASESKPAEGEKEKRTKKPDEPGKSFVGRRAIKKVPQTPSGPKDRLAFSGVPGGKRKDDPESPIHDEETMTIKLKREAVTHGDYRQDAFAVEFPAEAENAVNQISRRLDSANTHIESLQVKADAYEADAKKTKGEHDQKSEELDALKKKGDAIDPEKLDALADERADVKGVAHHLKVAEYADKSNDQIKAMIVKVANPDLKMDGMDPMIVEGRYQAICDGIRKDNKSLESLAALKQITSPVRQDGDKIVTDDEKSPALKYKEDMEGLHTMTTEQIEKKWSETGAQA